MPRRRPCRHRCCGRGQRVRSRRPPRSASASRVPSADDRETGRRRPSPSRTRADRWRSRAGAAGTSRADDFDSCRRRVPSRTIRRRSSSDPIGNRAGSHWRRRRRRDPWHPRRACARRTRAPEAGAVRHRARPPRVWPRGRCRRRPPGTSSRRSGGSAARRRSVRATCEGKDCSGRSTPRPPRRATGRHCGERRAARDHGWRSRTFLTRRARCAS